MNYYDRKRVLTKTEIIEFDQFDNKTLSEFIYYFTTVYESYKEEFPEIEPTIMIYTYGDDSGFDFQLNVYENESDEAYQRRVEYLEHLRKMKEDYKVQVAKFDLDEERQLYELLKKKFDGA